MSSEGFTSGGVREFRRRKADDGRNYGYRQSYVKKIKTINCGAQIHAKAPTWVLTTEEEGNEQDREFSE